MEDDWPNYRQRGRKWESFPTWSQDPRIPSLSVAIGGGGLSSASSTAVDSLAIESWWGRPGSPSMTKRWLLTSLPRLPIRSHLIGQTHTHRSPHFLPLSFFFSALFLFLSSSFARFETCIRAGTCGDRAASREFNNCRSSRSRVNTVPRAQSFYERLDISRIYIYVYIHARTRAPPSLRWNERSLIPRWLGFRKLRCRAAIIS